MIGYSQQLGNGDHPEADSIQAAGEPGPGDHLMPGGWTVTGELQGWQFRINVVESGLQVIASAPGGGDPAVWIVPN